MTQAVQMLLVLAPVVPRPPVVDELAQIGEVGSVVPGSIGHFVRETCAVEASLEVGEYLVGYLDRKWFDFGHGCTQRVQGRAQRKATVLAPRACGVRMNSRQRPVDPASGLVLLRRSLTANPLRRLPLGCCRSAGMLQWRGARSGSGALRRRHRPAGQNVRDAASTRAACRWSSPEHRESGSRGPRCATAYRRRDASPSRLPAGTG